MNRHMGRSRVGGEHNPLIEERIVYAATSDDLELGGLLIHPRGAKPGRAPLCIWVHTRQQGFSEIEYVRIGRMMAEAGHHFLSIDTRGHDFGAWFRNAEGPVLHGSAWERFSDCVYDLDAWLDRAAGLGFQSVVLIGHGFGGAKALHYQAMRDRAEVAALVLASSGTAVRDKFSDDAMELAHAMKDEGRGRDLMPWGTAGDMHTSTFSADWYVARARMHYDLYGDADMPPAIARVRCPIVAWFGRAESRENRDVSAFLDWMERNAVSAPSFQRYLIDNLPFFYRDRERQVVRVLLAALEKLGINRKETQA